MMPSTQGENSIDLTCNDSPDGVSAIQITMSPALTPGTLIVPAPFRPLKLAFAMPTIEKVDMLRTAGAADSERRDIRGGRAQEGQNEIAERKSRNCHGAGRGNGSVARQCQDGGRRVVHDPELVNVADLRAWDIGQHLRRGAGGLRAGSCADVALQHAFLGGACD